jgi:cephalosporin hydroxylase
MQQTEKLEQLRQQCQQIFANMGIDARTNSFAGVMTKNNGMAWLREAADLSDEQIEQLLMGFLSKRYSDFAERRKDGFAIDIPADNFIVSQGYKQGISWRGVPLGKSCYDISIYQELIQELKPCTIIEFGSGLGASSLFFSDVCKMFDLKAKVFTLDMNKDSLNPQVLDHPDIDFVQGNAHDIVNLLPIDLLKQMPHPWLVVEDCHHNVAGIVEHIFPFMARGDYLVIEDVGFSKPGVAQIEEALARVPPGSFLVDSFYTDMFGRNATCSPDSIFRCM